MPVIIDGSTGITTPGVTDTGNLSVAGSTTLTTPLPVLSGGTGASSLAGITVGTATSATNLAGGGANTVVYQSAAGTTAYITNGSTGQFLAANTSGAPTWGTPGGGFSQAQVFTSSGSFTVPSSGKFKVTIIGGGGSAGTREGSGTQGSGGGAGGGTVIKWFTGATPGATATVTVGAGGLGIVATSSTNGNPGGNSTFVLSGFTTLAANGGSAGIGTAVDSQSVAGGTATGGDLNIAGGRGCQSIETSGSERNKPSVSGSTLFGIGASNFYSGSAGIAGTGYGSGSGGTITTTSLAGQGGVCIVEF